MPGRQGRRLSRIKPGFDADHFKRAASLLFLIPKTFFMTQDYPPISTLHDLLDDDIRKFAGAEMALKNNLPRWISLAASVQLKTVLQKYEAMVDMHIQRFDTVFEEEGLLSLSRSHPAMDALIQELDSQLPGCCDAPIRDACLLAGIQVINHFKISIYGTAASFARELGLEKPAGIFHEAEINEKQIDDRLSQLAAFEINPRARTPFVIPG